MFMNSAKILFFFIMIMGTMITMSANSWLMAWMGLEVNLLAFIPLINNKNNLMSSEASLKYFLIQAISSIILLFAIILILKNNLIEISLDKNYLMILTALLTKMGAAPFHFWFPSVSESLTWMNLVMLMTWQKLAPLSLTSYINNNFMLNLSIILSAIIGAIGGLNQTSLRKLMVFSSINHISWMLISMSSNNMMWLNYFMFYSFLSMTLMFMFNVYKLTHINQLFLTLNKLKNLKFFTFFNFLSLGGLPPFLGFLPKWWVIQYMIYNNSLLNMMILLMMSLITLFFYLRLTYSAFMMNMHETKWIYYNFTKIKFNYIYLTISFFSSFGLLLISMIFYLY